MEQSDKRQRKRAPLSCLNCKKRKVRCDKQKPCSGCIKNNVPELCVYQEPKWVDNEVKQAAENPPDIKGLEALIKAQNEEIAQLRLKSASVSVPTQFLPVTVLKKLHSNDSLRINPETYTIEGSKNPHVAKPYSWFNIVKLDPQLTALWYKISSLQKSYHVYKQNLVLRHSKERKSASCGHSKCPVVACELNEEPLDPLPTTEPLIEGQDVNSLILHIRSSIYTLGRGDKSLSKEQVGFLVSFYLGLPSVPSTVLLYEFESRNLFRFYSEEILSTQDGHFADSTINGIYLSMLALIVEESLDILRLRLGVHDEVSQKFHHLFPAEAIHQGLGYKRTNIIEYVGKFLAFATQNNEFHHVLPCIAASVAFLNRAIALYKKRNAYVGSSELFTTIITRLLENVNFNGQNLMHLENPSKNLHNHISHVWCDTMRLTNLVLFSMIPLCNSDGLLDKVNIVLHTCSNDVPKEKDELGSSLAVYSLMAKTYLTLKEGIVSKSVLPVRIADLNLLITEISAWASDMSLTKIRMVRFFEIRAVLYYLEFYLTYVVFLQCEENDNMQDLVHTLMAKCLDVNKFLQGSLVQLSKSPLCHHVMTACAEILSKLLHMIVGLLIRFKSHSGDRLIYRSVSITTTEKDALIGETDQTLQLLDTFLDKETSQKANKMWRFYMTFVRSSHKMNPAAYAKIHAGVFKKLPTPAKGKCPILADDRAEINDFAEIVGSNNTTGECPVKNFAPTPYAGRKRLCPFDHESMRASPISQSFNESNMRGDTQEVKKEPSPRIPSPRPSIFGDSKTFLPDPAVPSPFGEGLDWDTLPNFDFDLMNDATLMDQISGGDFNNPMIEEMFQ